MTNDTLPDRSTEEIAPDFMDCPVYAIRDVDHLCLTDGEADAELAAIADHTVNHRDVSWLIVEGLWFTRQEAEAFLKATKYNFSKAAHVYAYPARGKLKTLLKAQTRLMALTVDN